MFKQVTLPYQFNDLEPHIDALTMETHYTGHHATYTSNLNNLAENQPLLTEKPLLQILQNLDQIPPEQREPVQNNGGGFLAHNLYFESLTPTKTQPTGDLLAQINKDFESLDNLIIQLTNAAVTQFGSGYAWLVYCPTDGCLKVTQTQNQDMPRCIPLLPIDVWEHAYYLKYRNKRADHIKTIFNIINWDAVARRFADATL